MLTNWDKVRSQLHAIASFNGRDTKYSARASFHFPGGFSSGEVLDIDTHDVMGCSISNTLIVLSFYVVTGASFVVLLFPATSILLQTVCIVLGILTTLLLLLLFSSANKKLLKRILLRSMTPYVKLYLVCVEAYSLCSLLDWKYRCFASVPLLFTSQLAVFVSDAVFYQNTLHTVALLVLFILSRVGLIFCVRYNIFGDLHYDVFAFSGFRFYNSGNLVSKSLSLLLFQLAQLVFYLRYRRRLFSIRTSYTIMGNSSWNTLERMQRLSVQEEKELEVLKTKDVLERNTELDEDVVLDDDLYRV